MDLNTLGIINSMGLAATLGGFIYVGRKLQILDDLKRTVDIIEHNLKVVTDHLIKFDKNFDHTELKAYSPYALTAKGKKLIKDLGFDNIVHQHRREFYGCIDGHEPVLKYDVEKAAIKTIHGLFDETYMQSLKVWLYNHPDRDITNLAPTLGVYLRDTYLADHPEITR